MRITDPLLQREFLINPVNSRPARTSRGFIVDGQDVDETASYAVNNFVGNYRKDMLEDIRKGLRNWNRFKAIAANFAEFYTYGTSNVIRENLFSKEMPQVCFDFIYDTALFITGSKRRMLPIQWEAMFEHQPALNAIPAGFRRKLADNPSIRRILCGDLSSPPELVAAWMARPGGLEDMLVSTEYIFGEHPAAKQFTWSHHS